MANHYEISECELFGPTSSVLENFRDFLLNFSEWMNFVRVEFSHNVCWIECWLCYEIKMGVCILDGLCVRGVDLEILILFPLLDGHIKAYILKIIWSVQQVILKVIGVVHEWCLNFRGSLHTGSKFFYKYFITEGEGVWKSHFQSDVFYERHHTLIS